MTQGEDISLLVSAVDQNGDAFAITRAIFTLRYNVGHPTALVTKDSDVSPTEVTVLTQSGSTLGQARIFVVRNDTLGLTVLPPTKHYVYDVWVVRQTGEKQCIVNASPFVIKPAVTLVIS